MEEAGSPRELQHLVHAKLRGTGAYALAAWSAGLTRSRAEDASYKSSPGDIALSGNEVALSSLKLERDERLVVAVSLGAWADAAGRPWLYRHVVFISQDDFDRIHGDPFALWDALVQKIDFDAPSEDLPALRLPVASPNVLAERHRQVLREFGNDSRLICVLQSILSGQRVLWIAGADATQLLEGCIAVLPQCARSAFTFASQAAQPLKLDAVVVVASRAAPGLGDSRADPLNLLGSVRASPNATVPEAVARSVAAWVTSDGLGPWHRAADRFVRAGGLDSSWTAVAGALVRSIRWFEKVLSLGSSATSEAADDLLRWAAREEIAPPTEEIADLVGRVALPEPALLESAHNGSRRSDAPEAWGRVTEHVGRAWATEPRDPSAWAELLECAAGLDRALPGAIIAAATSELVIANRLMELVSIAKASPGDQEWYVPLAEAVSGLFVQHRLASWKALDVLEAVFRPRADGWIIPSQEWMRTFVGDALGEFPETERVLALRDEGALLAALVTVAHTNSDEVQKQLADNLLLWILVSGIGAAAAEAGVNQARRAYAVMPLQRSSGEIPPGQSLKRTITRLLISDGLEVPYPTLDLASAEDLVQLLAALVALEQEDPPAHLQVAVLVVAAHMLKRRTGQGEAAALSIVTDYLRKPHLQSEVVVNALLDSASHTALAPDARGQALWDKLVLATSKQESAESVRQAVEPLVDQEVTALWPEPEHGRPRLSLACVEGLAAVAAKRPMSASWQGLVVAAAERIGETGRKEGVRRATETVATGVTLLRALCEAQAQRTRTPLPVTQTLKAAARDRILSRGMAWATRRALPRTALRHLRLQRPRGWK